MTRESSIILALGISMLLIEVKSIDSTLKHLLQTKHKLPCILTQSLKSSHWKPAINSPKESKLDIIGFNYILEWLNPYLVILS